MTAQRVLAIGLDGYEPTLGERLMAAGELPAMAALAARSARFQLDHGAAQRTGLAWEHLATGLSPEAAGRWAAVSFSPNSFGVRQEGTRLTPFAARLAAKTVVFDAPYFDLDKAPGVDGLTAWGAHDPGVEPGARPAGLDREIAERFGPYPAKRSVYGCAWPSVERAREMGAELTRAVEVRCEVTRWLLGERLPDWRLALIVASELHSGIEALWHGVDAAHALHGLPSAGPAGEGLVAIHKALDRMIGELHGAFPDATLVVFSLHGMGPNRSDVASMALLPELLHRHAFKRPLMREHPTWGAANTPMLEPGSDWSREVLALFPRRRPSWQERFARFLPAAFRPQKRGRARASHRGVSLTWMPAAQYRAHWPDMRAFALPSFYDGRVRVNLIGREQYGRVALAGYDRTLDEIEALLARCTDPLSGEPVVDFVERPAMGRSPLGLGNTEADLVFVWRGAHAFEHPSLGRIGPLPYRRTGGHTGRYGAAWIAGDGITPGERGVRSTFDVAPTLCALVGAASDGLSGRSLL